MKNKNNLLSPVTIRNHQFISTIGLAGGYVKNFPEGEKLARIDDCGFVEAGSYTIAPRTGNIGTTLVHEKPFTLNAIGLTNNGAEKSIPDLLKLKALYASLGKKLFISSAGMSIDEHPEMAKLFGPIADGFVLNAGCPNVYGKNGQKPIQSYDIDFMHESIRRVGEVLPDTCIFAVKVSPFKPYGFAQSIWPKMYSEFRKEGYTIVLKDSGFETSDELFENVADSIKKCGRVDMIITMNTLPNVQIYADSPKDCLLNFHAADSDVIQNTGGLSGAVVKELALENVRMWNSELWKTDIEICGCGGITNGEDMRRFLDAGASLVQIMSAHLLNNDGSKFGEILADCYSM